MADAENIHRSQKAAVEEWLNKGGFPLEMRVAKLLRAAGYRVSQADYYKDPNSGLLREIDVIASLFKRGIGNYDYVAATLAIECKRNINRPFVVFTHEPSATLPGIVMMSQIANPCARKILDSRLTAVIEQALFQLPRTIGYSMTSALRSKDPNSNDGKDMAYEALIGCTSAALALTTEENVGHRVAYGGRLVIPIVVASDELYQARLSESGDIEVEPTDFVMIGWNHQGQAKWPMYAWVCTERGFANLMAKLTRDLDEFLESITPTEMLLMREVKPG